MEKASKSAELLPGEIRGNTDLSRSLTKSCRYLSILFQRVLIITSRRYEKILRMIGNILVPLLKKYYTFN